MTSLSVSLQHPPASATGVYMPLPVEPYDDRAQLRIDPRAETPPPSPPQQPYPPLPLETDTRGGKTGR